LPLASFSFFPTERIPILFLQTVVIVAIDLYNEYTNCYYNEGKMKSKNAIWKFVGLGFVITLGIYFGMLFTVDRVGATSQYFGYPYPPPNNKEPLSQSLPYPPPVSASPTPQITSQTPTSIPQPPKLIGEKMYPCGKDTSEQPLIDKAVKWIGVIEQLPVASYFLSSSHFVSAIELKKCFLSVTVINQKNGEVVTLFVNTDTQEVSYIQDIDKLRQNENNKSKKIDTALKDRLNKVISGDKVEVMIWFKTPKGEDLASQQKKAFDYLVNNYPKAFENNQKFGKPLGIENDPDSNFINQEYERLMQQVKRPGAISNWVNILNSREISVKEINPMPAIFATLTAQQIDEIAVDPEVDMVYLAEARTGPALLDAGASQRFTSVWNSGINGNGQTIAILEAGNVQRNNNFLSFTPSVRISQVGEISHTTNVAACAASSYANGPGSGRGANILSVGTSTLQSDSISGFIWATGSPQSAKIVNNSEAIYTWPAYEPSNRGFDYWARYYLTFVTVAAGNDGSHVASPATAYNVLAVGSFNNNNTSDWSDDVMSNFSSWQNPVSPNNDREKPEVVAVGENLMGWGWGNQESNFLPGTSFASPQVAGLGALLLNRNQELTVWPEAMRAIVMASAIHDLDGNPRIVPGTDSRDGAGGIVGDQAIYAAEQRGTLGSACLRSCWWGLGTTSIPLGGNQLVTFSANSGQRVRVAISWWAAADGPTNNYASEALNTNLDLKVKDPTGNYFTNSTSTSQDNNYELVDFTALASGIYTIEIHKNQNSIIPNESNYVGVALVIPHYSTNIPLVAKQ
jgi:hypothetical protein